MCGNVLEKVVDASVMICPKCGVSEPYLESTRNGLGFNEDVEFVNNTYKRQNHFQEWLNQVQARETAPIPDKVIQKIAWQLHQLGTRRTEDITRAKVRAALKALRLRRYYENISSILCQLTGVKPRRLLKHEEMQLKNMFLVIQKPFERHCPKNRSNFFELLVHFVQVLRAHRPRLDVGLFQAAQRQRQAAQTGRNLSQNLPGPGLAVHPEHLIKKNNLFQAL